MTRLRAFAGIARHAASHPDRLIVASGSDERFGANLTFVLAAVNGEEVPTRDIAAETDPNT